MHTHMLRVCLWQVAELPPSIEDEPPEILVAIGQVLRGGNLSKETFLKAVAGAPKPRNHDTWARVYQVLMQSLLVARVEVDYKLLQGGTGSWEAHAEAVGLANPKEMNKLAQGLRAKIKDAFRSATERAAASAPASDDAAAAADNDEPPPKRTCTPLEVHKPY